NLKKEYGTIREIAKNELKDFGTGIQGSKGKEETDHLIGKKLIDPDRGLTHFRANLSGSTIFNKRKIHRAKKGRSIFRPPYVLFKKGINTKNLRIRAAYSEEEFIYSDAIYGISGDTKDRMKLLSINGLLNSSFYAYLNLMLGTSVGVEREQA